MSIIDYNDDFFSGTDVGLVRKANEDSCGTAVTPNGYLFVVCDGMGGHVGGAKASGIAVDSIIEFFKSATYSDVQSALNDALLYANSKIWNTAIENPEFKGMGTTACVLLIKDEKVWYAHVGDSRIYIFSDRQLHRITKDHSYVQGLVDQGMITDAEAEEHPNKNRILKALGIRENVKPSVCKQPALPKNSDIFMLCSDGLNGMVNDLTMRAIIDKNTSLNDRGAELIHLAKQAGGTDNITVQLVSITNSQQAESIFENFTPKENILPDEDLPAVEESPLEEELHEVEELPVEEELSEVEELPVEEKLPEAKGPGNKPKGKLVLIIVILVVLLVAVFAYINRVGSKNKPNKETEIESTKIEKPKTPVKPTEIKRETKLSSWSYIIKQVYPEENTIGNDTAIEEQSLDNKINTFKNELAKTQKNYLVYKFKPNSKTPKSEEPIQNIKWYKSINGIKKDSKSRPQFPKSTKEVSEIVISQINVWGNEIVGEKQERNYNHYYKFFKKGEAQEISEGSMQSFYREKDSCIFYAEKFLNLKKDNNANYKCVVYDDKNNIVKEFLHHYVKWKVNIDSVQIGVFGKEPTLQKLKSDYKLKEKANEKGSSISLQFYTLSVDWESKESGEPILIEPTPKPKVESEEQETGSGKNDKKKKNKK